MLVALFILPVALTAISVGAAMFCSPFVASYILFLIFQTCYQDPDHSSTEWQLIGVFLIPVGSFALTVGSMMFSTQQRKKVLAWAPKAPAGEENWVDPRDMLFPVGKRRRVRPDRGARERRIVFSDVDYETYEPRRQRERSSTM